MPEKIDVAAEFEAHGDAVYNHCFRRSGDWSTAEELTSAVFLHAWGRRDSALLVDGSALPWLLGIANNVLRNHARMLRRRVLALGRRAPDPPHTEDHCDEIASRVDDERRMRQILPLLRQLPIREQDIVTLVFWSGLSYEETARALSIPVGTVRSRLARA